MLSLENKDFIIIITIIIIIFTHLPSISGIFTHFVLQLKTINNQCRLL